MTTRLACGGLPQRPRQQHCTGLVAGCATAHVKVDPLEVKPITVNVNVNLRVQQQLDQFFAFEDKLLTGDTTRPATAPATAAAHADIGHGTLMTNR